jgi:hypothetical protein
MLSQFRIVCIVSVFLPRACLLFAGMGLGFEGLALFPHVCVLRFVFSCELFDHMFAKISTCVVCSCIVSFFVDWVVCTRCREISMYNSST